MITSCNPPTHGTLVRPPGACSCFRRFAIAVLATVALGITTAFAASNLVQYSYDAAGNVVSIQRIGPAPIGISGFAPSSGPPGTIVTISGSGFSPTAAGNGVTFNGVAAPAFAATTNALSVAVPNGAATGRIAVSVAGSTAVSAQDFVVTVPGVPTITGFAPATGSAGTPVTITGTNFNSAVGATTVRLNQNAANVSAATTTQLTFAVPAATGSGRIRVTTSSGTAVSATDFIVPPGTTAASDIVSTARLVPNGPAQSVGIFTSNKAGLILFEGNAGDWLSVQIANFAINPASGAIAYSVYKPDNTQLTAGTLSASNLTIHIPPLPATGTFAVLLRSGITQVSLEARLEANVVIPVDGSTAVTTRSAGQTTRALIAAMAGDQKALMVSSLTTLPATSVAYAIALPNGSTFRNGAAFGLGTTTLLPPFTVTGTHPVVFTPASATTQTSFRLGLLAGTTLPVDGPAANLAIANPGEGGRLNFAGTAGENLGVGVTSLALNPASVANSSFAVYRPDATLLASGNCYADGTQCSANLPNLPVTGSYSIIVQPANGATGSMQLWLSHDVAATLTNGAPSSHALTRPGQNARLMFQGVAGALIAVQVRGVVTSPAGEGILVQVNQPGGSMLAYTHLTGNGQTVVVPPLPATGTYTVFLEPESAGKGAATASMDVLVDPGQSLIVDGPTQNATVGIAGASARFTFAGTAGQNLGLGIGNLALNPVSDATIWIYKPDGASLTSISCSRTVGACAGNLTNLPGTGTHGIVVVPASGATGSFSVALSTDLGATLTVGGAPVSISLNRSGRNARLTFAGSTGQTLRLSWSGVAIVGPAVNAIGTISRPDGSLVGNLQFVNGVAGSYDIPALPAPGNYTLFIDPMAGATMNATLTLITR